MSMDRATPKQNPVQAQEEVLPFHLFPSEVLARVFQFTRPEIILTYLARVSKQFLFATQFHSLWEFKQAQHFWGGAKEKDQTSFDFFKSNYVLAYPDHNGRLFSCVIENDVATLRSMKLTLKDCHEQRDSSGETLFDLVFRLKNQETLNYIYELARVAFIHEDGKTLDTKKIDQYKKTILFWAAQTNQVDAIAPLILSGADINQGRTSDGVTPLFIASQYGHLKTVKKLIEYGANAKQVNISHGSTPLMIALHEGYQEVAKCLIPHSDVRQAELVGRKSIHVSAQNGQLEMLKLLIGAGAQQEKDDLIMLLWLASLEERFEVVKYLLELGADLNQPIEGMTLLFTLAMNGRVDMAAFLREAGAKLGMMSDPQYDWLSKNENADKVQNKNKIIHIERPVTSFKNIQLLVPKPDMPRLPAFIVNVSMIWTLEVAHQLLIRVIEDKKNASSVRNLIDMIYSDIDELFSNHVAKWQAKNQSQNTSVDKQEMIGEGVSEEMKAIMIGCLGFFAELKAKPENIGLSDLDKFINGLVTHSQLWTGQENQQENAADPASLQNENRLSARG